MDVMPTVAITASDEGNARRYVEAVAQHARTRLITPSEFSSSPGILLEGMGGLLLTGGSDIDPLLYGTSPEPEAGLEVSRKLDSLELGLLRCALDRDVPVLAICRGMHLLNVAFGGKLPQNIPGHEVELKNGEWASAHHSLYLSPGSKLAAILGRGGFFRVNSRHHQGLREAQKAPRLLASAYSTDDGVIEGLESPEHSWVVGVQCHPERLEEVPKVFGNLFLAFTDRAEEWGR